MTPKTLDQHAPSSALFQRVVETPLADWLNFIAASAAAIAAWLSWKSANRAAKAAEMAAQRATRLEGMRAAQNALADSIHISNLRESLTALYDGLFQLAGAYGGSAHEQAKASADLRARRVGEVGAKAGKSIERLRSTEVISDNELVMIVSECIGFEANVRRVRDWFEIEVESAEGKSARETSR